MFGGPSPVKLASRLSALALDWAEDGPEARAQRARRRLLTVISERAPVTLGAVADAVGRGAPAVSRSVDALVRDGLVDRVQDSMNRRRLSLTLTKKGVQALEEPWDESRLVRRLERFAASELRAIERAVEILERAP